jgi:hypothetical protein
MCRKKHFVLLIIVLFLFSIYPVFAQKNNSDISVIGIETGAVFAYNLDAMDYGPGYYFTLNLNVADNFQVGFCRITGDGINSLDYNLFKVSYFFLSKLGVDVVIGSDGAMQLAAGAGVFYNIFENRVSQQLSTVLRLSMDYIYTDTTNPLGSIVIKLGGQVGI